MLNLPAWASIDETTARRLYRDEACDQFPSGSDISRSFVTPCLECATLSPRPNIRRKNRLGL